MSFHATVMTYEGSGHERSRRIIWMRSGCENSRKASLAEAANLREQRDGWKIGKGVLKEDFNAGRKCF